VPSGKKSKQMRRTAPPPVQSKGSGPRRRQANPRVLAIGGGVAAVAILAIVLGLVLSGGGKSASGKDFPAVGSIAAGLPEAAEVAGAFKGIPQRGLTLGKQSAPVTLVEYIDLQCPFCQEFETQLMPSIITKYVRTGKLKVEARPLAFIGPGDSIRGRNAMLAAADQDRAFNFSQLLYLHQGAENTWLNDSIIGQAASSIPGLRVHDLFAKKESGAVKDQAKGFDDQAVADKVSGTPTLYVGKSGTKGKLVTMTSSTDAQALVDAIEAALPQ
jgi:protein-disulfide isomerase